MFLEYLKLKFYEHEYSDQMILVKDPDLESQESKILINSFEKLFEEDWRWEVRIVPEVIKAFEYFHVKDW